MKTVESYICNRLAGYKFKNAEIIAKQLAKELKNDFDCEQVNESYNQTNNQVFDYCFDKVSISGIVVNNQLMTFFLKIVIKCEVPTKEYDLKLYDFLYPMFLNFLEIINQLGEEFLKYFIKNLHSDFILEKNNKSVSFSYSYNNGHLKDICFAIEDEDIIKCEIENNYFQKISFFTKGESITCEIDNDYILAPDNKIIPIIKTFLQ